MLTQFETTETQAALLAAYPRPRALAPCTTAPTSSVTTMPAPSVPSEWSRFAPISAAVSARVSGLRVFAEVERPAACYASVVLTAMAGVRADFTTVGGNGTGNGRLIGEARVNGNTGSTKQQDQKHLTARREPVTWRPPH